MRIVNVNSNKEFDFKAAAIVAAQVLLKPYSVLGLATGSTPVGMYDVLVNQYQQGLIDFSKAYCVNLDEYQGLEVDDKQSYHFYMKQYFFSKINISKDRTFIPNGSAENLDHECLEYDRLINELGGIDLQILGIGHNGHIGFNEPCNEFIMDTHCVQLDEQTIMANAKYFTDYDSVPKKAITMGIKNIMHAKKILLLVNGKDKSEILQKALFGAVTPTVPASILQLHKDVIVIANT